MKRLMVLAAAAALLATAGCASVTSGLGLTSGSGYHVVQKLPLGGEGGWDALAVDSDVERLYLSRGTHVMVVDLHSGKPAGDIPNTSGVHGIALAPDLGRGFTSNGRDDTCTIFDLKTLATIGTVKTGADPDAIVYDSFAKRVFVFNGRSNDTTVIDAATGEVVGTIPLGGRPEFAVTDKLGTVYANIEDKNEVVTIDTNRLAVTARYSISPGEGPTGIAIDVLHHRAFSACRNKVMVVLDTSTGKVAGTAPIGSGADGAGYDPGRQLAFSSNGGDGTLSVVRESRPGNYVAEKVETQKSARTMAIDPATHLIYLPAAEFGPAPAGTLVDAHPRPPMVEGSFTVLVVGR
jgi:YVTN family beta-propeller protein